jgi:hypothetical protein
VQAGKRAGWKIFLKTSETDGVIGTNGKINLHV